jgi:heme O synthase-like polyprenyltransferase
MLAQALAFVRAGDKDAPARRLFFTSIAFLPAFLMVLLVDRYL